MSRRAGGGGSAAGATAVEADRGTTRAATLPDRTPLRRARLGPAGRTLTLCVLGLGAGLAFILTVLAAAGPPADRARELAQRTMPAQTALVAALDADVKAQREFLATMQAPATSERLHRLAVLHQEAQRAQSAWARYRALALGRPGEARLQRAVEAATREAQLSAAKLVTLTPGSRDYRDTLARQASAAEAAQTALAALTGIYGGLIADDAGAVHRGLTDARRNILSSYGVITLAFCLVGVLLMRGARRDQRLLVLEAQAARDASRRANFEAALQRGLEMQPTEEDSYAVVGRAFAAAMPAVAVELLMADSSRAHFRQVVAAPRLGDAACPVAAPAQCPAVRNGLTCVFADSTHIDSCPLLRGRTSPVWATCTPVSVTGRPNGVIHAEGPVGSMPARLADELELVARKAGERISAIRVLARTQAQAQVDPLSGLPNRRTLDDSAQELLARNVPFVVAFADLDEFKSLNDTHGHDTGDRALRLFARVLRDNVRPDDLIARYGGEEFLAVFPNCTLTDARAVAERVRTQLGALLDRAATPRFTVTVGLAPHTPGEDFAETVSRADAAMLAGKRLGRNRVVVAGEEEPQAGPAPVQQRAASPTTTTASRNGANFPPPATPAHQP